MADHRTPSPARRVAPRGFTLIELLVVITIIALLVGILMPTIITSGIRAKEMATHMQLRGIANACMTYQGDQHAMPGVVSDAELAADPVLQSELTSTENMLLSLMGAVVDAADASRPWSPSSVPPSMTGRVVDLDLIGSGARSRAGHRLGSYLSPSDMELATITGTLGADNDVPELVDRWRGLPILALRAQTPKTPSVLAADSGLNAYFLRNTVRDYTEAMTLKSARGDVLNQRSFSMLSDVAVGSPDAANNLAWIVAQSQMSNVTSGVSGSANDGNDAARGSLVLIAAGYDQIYFSKDELDEYPTEDAIDDFADLKGFDDIIEVAQ
ncbi:MAG: prepilin-type N-terminal cleavage/methylation domain-containing protein [Phycisphaera sp.]|nr:prepilin-type N-terminal cleavage/methylation domain-containing protein [Phycisphaera sp.]